MDPSLGHPAEVLWGAVWAAWGPCSSDQLMQDHCFLQGLVLATMARAGGRGSGTDLSRLPWALWLWQELLALQSSHRVSSH